MDFSVSTVLTKLFGGRRVAYENLDLFRPLDSAVKCGSVKVLQRDERMYRHDFCSYWRRPHPAQNREPGRGIENPHPQDALDFGWWILVEWNSEILDMTIPRMGDSPGWFRTRKCQVRRLWSMLRKILSLGPDYWTMPLNLAFINGELTCAQWKRMGFWSFKIRRNMFPKKLFVTYFHLFSHQRLGLNIEMLEILAFQHIQPQIEFFFPSLQPPSQGFFRISEHLSYKHHSRSSPSYFRNVKTWTASKDLNFLTLWFF